MRSRRFPTASPSSRSPAATRRPEFARLVASRRIARIEPSALACTPDEAEAILGSNPLDAQTLQRITRQSDGWVAALVLLREHLSRDGATLDESIGEGKDAIFQYFAGEIFNRALPENQRILMLTAIPPSFTQAEAIALGGEEQTPRLLDYLYRRHLFIDRRRGTPTTYHYHGLFREFLLEEAKRRLSTDERRLASARAALLMEARGQASEALALFRDADNVEAMRRVIIANALDWARQGRAQTLSDWIEALPQAMREADPWLEYWYGRAWIFVRPPLGRPALECAYEAFRAAGDLRGQALALNTIVTGYYYEWANFVPLDRWLPEFDRLLGPENASKTRSRKRIARAGRARHRAPVPPAGGSRACGQRPPSRRAHRYGEGDLNARMMAASTLFNYLNWTTKGDSADGLVARIEPILAAPDVTPLMQVWWRTHLSFWHHVNGRYDQSAAVIAEAREIAERYGLAAYLFEIDHAVASALISKGDYVAAADLLRTMERRLSPARRMDWAYFHHLQANLEQRLGHFGNAAKAAEKAVELARDTGLPSMQLPHFLARLAHSRITAGDRDGGMRAMEEAIAAASDVDRKTFEQQRELVLIEEDIDAGQTQRATERLAAVLAEYRARGQVMFLRNRPDLAARLANHALRHGIETEFVHTLIERNLLAAPADAAPAWPFRLRIKALGGFELDRDGMPMRFTGKAQQRPLDLLKLLVALGGHGRGQPAADGGVVAGRRRRRREDIVRHDALSPAQAARRRQRARAFRRQALACALARVDRRMGAARRLRCGGPRRRYRGGRRLGGPRRAPSARRLSGRAARRRRSTVDREAARCPALALRADALAPRRAARTPGRLCDRHRCLPARYRSRQSRRVVLSRTHAHTGRDGRSSRGAQRFPALPRAAVHRPGREAIR